MWPPKEKKKRKGKKGQRKKAKKLKGFQASITIDLTVENVRTTAKKDAHMEGLVAMNSRKKSRRTNWDKPENAALRTKLAESWLGKKELYRAGETFCRFCERNGIDRNVLSRFIARKNTGVAPKKRGRPTKLSEDVIRHLCEGWYWVFFC